MKALARFAGPLLVLAFVLPGCGSSNRSEPAAGLQTGFREPRAHSLQALEREPYPCSKSNEQCLIRDLTKITRRYGPRASLALLGDLGRRGRIEPSFDTHQLAHLVGEATAKQFGANKRAFSLCPNSFNYGCVHGFFIYVLGRSNTPTQAANLICKSSGGPLVPTFSCYHGVGHGVMMARGNDLKASLDVCDSLGGGSAADACWQGVFMENVNAEMRHQARPGVFSRSHPLRPCTRVEASYRHECYINQAGWLAYLASDDVSKATGYCLAAPRPYVSVCAQSIGLMVTNPSWQSSFVRNASKRPFARVAWDLCMRFPKRLRSDCVLGGVDNLANFDQLNVRRSDEFCLLTGGLQATCYREIGVNLARRTTVPALARARCRSLSVHARDCLAGIRQGLLPSAPVVVPKPKPAQQPATSAKQASATVRMTSSGFSPRVLTIKRGQTVEFVNDSHEDYWPASNPHPTHTDYPAFVAPNIVLPGKSWSFTFDRAGRWGYHNHLSPQTTGVVVVTSGS
jgi:plastocyanin